jgi:hypothetical protein
MLNEISLFVMRGCSLCPQMERLFKNLHENGAISGLNVVDVTDHPELARQHNIRSVPFYLINGVAFSGLKSKTEIDQLLQQNSQQNWVSLIKQELSEGQLDAVEKIIRENHMAREAMMFLLADDKTELVVRIGLTAIIESIAEGQLLAPYETQFITMTKHEDERIAVDALYYLSLLNSPGAMIAVNEIAHSGKQVLREHARELLEETTSKQVLH